MRDFYSIIKAYDKLIYFVFITGVSKFSKVSIFSGINNLEDISLNSDYATICGYTHKDLETYFGEHLEGVDLEEVRRWYNGYNFLGERVYNPFDILLFIKNHKTFDNYWFETGTPTFLVKLIKKNKYYVPNLESIEVGKEIISSYDIETMDITTILYQTGYLTIKEEREKYGNKVYELTYPNKEVRYSLNNYLFYDYYRSAITKSKISDKLYKALKESDKKEIEESIKLIFSSIAYTNYLNNEISGYEGFYSSVIYTLMASLNCEVILEDITSVGRADMTIKIEDKIYVMEFKVVDKSSDIKEGVNEALKQIKKRGYSNKYKGMPGKKVYEVGMIFDKTERNLIRLDWEKV